ncbi:MAG: DUF2934 domain-containing protein [Planctomycetes bacterium]|jgi:hypothetical protein|nr:DUF2934 domain-containing protein [Planctomycetota bacterium]
MGRQETRENGISTSSSQAGGATAAAPRRSGAKSRPAADGPKITHDQIARRAHELWVQQGCPHGRDRENWFEAEKQLRAELASN